MHFSLPIALTVLAPAIVQAQVPSWGVAYYANSDCSDDGSDDVQLFASTPDGPNVCTPTQDQGGVAPDQAQGMQVYCEGTVCSGYLYACGDASCTSPIGSLRAINDGTGCVGVPQGSLKALLFSTSDQAFP